MAELTEAEGRWRTLIVAAVAVAYPLGQTGFQLGAYGELLFENKLTSWIAVTATLIVCTAMPRKFLPVPRWHLWIFAFPSIWLLARFAMGLSDPGAVVHPLIYAAGIAGFALSFPYAIYLVVLIANPGLLVIRGFGLWSILGAIGAIFFVSGFLVGNWNEFFVACQDARTGQIEGSENCLSGTE